MTTLKKTTIAVSGALALGLGVAGNANADTLATSVLRLSGLEFTSVDSGNQLDVADFEGLVFNSSADISATLSSGGTDSDTGNSSAGAPINLQPVCVGDCPAIADNAFPIISSSSGAPMTQFAAADQNEEGSPISGFPGIADSATVESGAYVSLIDPDVGSATSDNDLSATFVFTLSEDGGVTISFDALAYLEAFASLGEVPPGNAQASYELSFDIQDDSGSIFAWAPDGDAGGITGGTETLDPFSLNTTISRNAPFTGVSFRGSALGSPNNGSFSATTGTLTAGTVYTLTAHMGSGANAQSAAAIPEPGVVALLGIGLLGLGFARRRV